MLLEAILPVICVFLDNIYLKVDAMWERERVYAPFRVINPSRTVRDATNSMNSLICPLFVESPSTIKGFQGLLADSNLCDRPIILAINISF